MVRVHLHSKRKGDQGRGGMQKHDARFRSLRITISQKAELLTQGKDHELTNQQRSQKSQKLTLTSLIHGNWYISQTQLADSQSFMITMSDANATTPRVFIARHGKLSFCLPSDLFYFLQCLPIGHFSSDFSTSFQVKLNGLSTDAAPAKPTSLSPQTASLKSKGRESCSLEPESSSIPPNSHMSSPPHANVLLIP